VTTVDDPNWVSVMLGLCALHEREAVTTPVHGSLWASRSTGRRGRVLWASHNQVTIEWREGVGSTFDKDNFLRLYQEI